MRLVLIFVNLLLAVWLVAAVGTRFTGKTSPAAEYSVKKGGARKGLVGKSSVTAKKIQPESIDSMAATIVDNNIFNPDRCPNGIFGRNRSSRVELSLVGTFVIGNLKGAIILQKTSTRQNNFMGGMMGMMGGGSPDMGGNSRSSNRNSSRGSARTRFGVNGNRRSSGTASNGESGDSAAKAATVKQYVRVGETLSNGYTLTEVSRTGAVLTRGGDKMELELLTPSKNQFKTAPAAQTPTNPYLDQLQQMQRMQMFQNFGMMRMLRESTRNQNQNQSGNRGGNSSRNSRNSGGGPGGPPPGM